MADPLPPAASDSGMPPPQPSGGSIPGSLPRNHSRRGWWKAAGGLGGRTLVWLLLVGLAVAAADRSRAVLDLSADHRFSLSPELTTLLRAQAEPVEIVGIWPAEEADRFDIVGTDLALMAAAGTRVSWRHIDPTLQKPALDQFAERYHDADVAVYVCRGERSFKIPLSDYTRLVLQREVGGALVSLADPHHPRAVLTQGHGELRPGGGSDDGCDLLAHALELAGYDVAVVDASTGHAVPPDATLIVAGPTAPFGPADLAMLGEHLRDGGSVLVLADDRAPRDLCVFLRQRGLMIGAGFPAELGPGHWDLLLDPEAATAPGVVVHSMRHYFAGQAVGFANAQLLLGHFADASTDEPMILDHPATVAVAHAGTLVLSPRTTRVEAFTAAWLASTDEAVAKRFASTGEAPIDAAKLFQTMKGDAWIQPFKPGLDAPRGLDQADARVVAWALEYPPSDHSVRAGVGARLVAWGSRAAACNGTLAQVGFANPTLLRDLVGWLARRAAPTSIPQAEFTAYQVVASDRTLFLLLGLLVVVVPCLCLGGAMLTWWDRR